jgi:hypothetical protein
VTTGFFHAVYFYPAENGTSEDAAALLEGCKKYLTKIPSLTYFSVGTPAGTPRSVVDNTYSVALLTGFADAAGHDLYQDHPDHLAFIENCKKYWSRVQVYDSVI